MAKVNLGSITNKSIVSYYDGSEWGTFTASGHDGFAAGGKDRRGGVIKFKTPTFANATGYKNYTITISKLDIVNKKFTDSATNRLIYAVLYKVDPTGRDPDTNIDLNTETDDTNENNDKIGIGSVSYGTNGDQLLSTPTSITIECSQKLASNTTYYLWVRGQTYDFIDNIFYNDTFNGSVSAETVSYTITYNLNGGTAASTLKTSYSVASTTFTLPQVTKKGYTFTGWTGSNGTTPKKTVTITKGSTTGNKTYTANFTEHTLTLSLYGNGATSATYQGESLANPGTAKLREQTFKYSTDYPNGIANIENESYLNIKKTGYHPTGNWSTSKTTGSGDRISQNFGGTGEEIADMLGTSLEDGSQILNIYVEWEPNTLTLVYKKNTGTIQDASAEKQLPYTSTETYGNNYNDTNGLINISTFKLSKPGHFADSWNTKADGSGTTIYQDTAYTAQALASECGKNLGTGDVSIDLYPYWQAKTLTIEYQKNDGSEGTAHQSFTYGANSGNDQKFGYKLDGKTPQWGEVTNDYAKLYGFGQWYREGYKIIGWATSDTGSATLTPPYYVVKDNWINTQVGNAASKTIKLWAVWDYNGTVRIYKDSAWKMALPYIYTKVGTETQPSWHLALPYTYAKGSSETSPSWHLDGR